MWRQALTIQRDDPAGRRWMDGEETEEEQSSQSRVKSECYVQASRPGLNHGLCRHHRAQVEGVEGLMNYVPQVVTRKGCMPAPRTRLQHLVDSKILSKKNRRSNTTRLTSPGSGHGKCRSRELVSA